MIRKLDKRGKGPANLLVILVVAALVAYLFVPQFQTTVNGFFGGSTTTTGTTTSGGTTINTVNPIVQVTGLDRQAQGTSVSSSAKGAFTVNGVTGGYKTITLGTDTAVPGQSLALLLTNNTSYHNAIVPAFEVKSGSFPVTVYFNKNATVTENIYTTTGLVISNGGGTQNQTALGNGASYNLKDEMTAASLTSTQDMVCVIEIEAGSNASTTPMGATFALNGVAIPLKSQSKPVWYSTIGTTSNVYLFDVAALDTPATRTFTIGLNSKSTGAFIAGSRMVKSCYTKEYFVDPNTGVVTYDVADSDGTLKSMATYTYTVYFQ